VDSVAPPQGGEFNPYKAPQAEVGGVRLNEQATPPGEPSAAMVSHLKGTGPWALFLAIMGFISGGFMLLSGVSSAAIIPFMSAIGDQPSGLPSAFGSGIFAFTAVFYVVGGAIYGITSYYLVRYSQAIGRVTRTRTFESVEGALATQQKFWKIVGITTIILIVLTMLFMVAIVGYSMSMASSLANDLSTPID